MDLPKFTHHPDPVASGVVLGTDQVCICCGIARGHVYSGPVYGESDLEKKLCLWCIFDGLAASRLDASFADAHPLIKAGVDDSVIVEVHRRTPAFFSWQEPEWLTHCSDAYEFHGDAMPEDGVTAKPQTKENWMSHYKQNEAGWKWVTEGYRPGCDSALYKFVCRHCGLVLFEWDLG